MQSGCTRAAEREGYLSVFESRLTVGVEVPPRAVQLVLDHALEHEIHPKYSLETRNPRPETRNLNHGTRNTKPEAGYSVFGFWGCARVWAVPERIEEPSHGRSRGAPALP